MGIHGGLPPVTPPFGMPNAGDSSDKSPAECIREGVATIEAYLTDHNNKEPNIGFLPGELPQKVAMAEMQIYASSMSSDATPELKTAAGNYLTACGWLLHQGGNWHTDAIYSQYTGPRDELTALLDKLSPPS